MQNNILLIAVICGFYLSASMRAEDNNVAIFVHVFCINRVGWVQILASWMPLNLYKSLADSRRIKHYIELRCWIQLIVLVSWIVYQILHTYINHFASSACLGSFGISFLFSTEIWSLRVFLKFCRSWGLQ